MLAEFEVIGRVSRITDLSARRESNTFRLVTVATTKSWKNADEQWQEKTFFHTLTVYSGLAGLAQGLDVGDLVRFAGDIESWSTKVEGSDEYRQGVTLVARERRILMRKRQSGTDEPSSEVGRGSGSTSEAQSQRTPSRSDGGRQNGHSRQALR
jgi:single-stranded DNA-binding protein